MVRLWRSLELGYAASIQYALYYPERRYLDGERLDFHKLKEITFEDPDMDTFLGLPMAMDAARKGGSMPTVFNAANELAVKKFLQEKSAFWIFTTLLHSLWKDIQ